MRKALMIAAICFSLITLSVASEANAEIRQPTNFPPQSLRAALQTLSQERGFQIIFRTDIVGDLATAGAKGNLTRDEALSQLLSGTGLIYRPVDEETVTIVRAGTTDGSGAANGKVPPRVKSNVHGSRSSSFWGRFRLAQVGQKSAAGDSAAMKASQDATAEQGTATEGSAATEEGSPLQEVIVTAQKYQQRAFDVPISLVTLTSDELQRREIANLPDLAFSVPGLNIENTGIQPLVTLRGVSNGLGNGAFVGEYADEADITPAASSGGGGYGNFQLQTYDLQRVEVLRGPQGTLFGVGAMGGVIRFITNKPELDDFQMSSEVAAMFSPYGAPSQRIQAMINTPIITDTLGLRFAGDFEHDGGWIDEPAADLSNINDTNLVDMRIEGLWQPASNVKVNVMQLIHRDAYGVSTGEQANGNYTQAFNLTTSQTAQENFNLTNLTVTYDFGRFELLNSTTYFNHELWANNWAYVIPNNPVFAENPQAIIPYHEPDEDTSEELRLSNTGDGPWHGTIGVFYKRFKDAELKPQGFYYGPCCTLSAPLTVGYAERDLSDSWSAFADDSYTLLNRLTIGAGVRYFRDHESDIQTDASGVLVPYQTAEFSSTDPRAYARYAVSQNINVYASAAKGFRSGGFNASYLGGPSLPAYGPEDVVSYELGTKIRLFDRRVSIDADVFDSEYQKFLVDGSPLGSLELYLLNGGDVRIKGVEGDLTWRVLDGWSLSVSGDYYDAKFVRIYVSGAGFFAGQEANDVPPYTFSASIEREFRVANKQGFARLDYSEVAREIQAQLGTPLSQSELIRMLNFHSGIQWNENLSFGIFAQNLLNDRGFLTPADPALWEIYRSTREAPRTLGIEFGVNF